MITRVAETRVEEIRVAERAPATKLSALMYRLQATLKTIFRSDSGKGPSFYFRRIFNSFSCSCEIADGESIMTRSEEHTSELQSLMRISYAVFCLKKKTIIH